MIASVDLQGWMKRFWGFCRHVFKKTFTGCVILGLVMVLSPLFFVCMGLLFVLAIFCAVLMIVGFLFGLSALFWVAQWFMNRGGHALPWV